MIKKKHQSKKLKNIKQYLPIISILCVFAIGGIVAYLMDQDYRVNNFVTGDVKILLHEDSWNPTIDTNEDDVPDAVKIHVGQSVPKDPQIENTGETDAYVYLKLYIPMGTYNDGLTTVTGGSILNYEIDTENWEELEGARCTDGTNNIYVYCYKNVLPAPDGETPSITPPLFNEITLRTLPDDDEKIVSVRVEAYAMDTLNVLDGTTYDITEMANSFVKEAIGHRQNITTSTKISLADCELNSENIEICRKDSITIKAKKPDGEIDEVEELAFKSSDYDVVSVDDLGNITGIALGNAEISVIGKRSGVKKIVAITVVGRDVAVADCTISPASMVLNVGESDKITVTDPNGDDVESFSLVSLDENVAVAFDNGTVTGSGNGETSITVIGTKSGTSQTVNVKVTKAKLVSLTELASSSLGDYVDVGTDLLDRTITLADGSKPLTDWRVFNKDENGTWLMLSNYLLQSEIPSGTGLTNVTAPYNVKHSSNRTGLLNGLNNQSVWRSLLTGTSLQNNSNVIVKGGIDLPTWVESWNSNVGYTTLYIASNSTGYKIGNSVNPSTNFISLKSDEGYNNTLYYPEKEKLLNCGGYWLNSLSADGDKSAVCVKFFGELAFNWYSVDEGGVRPVIYIPNNN